MNTNKATKTELQALYMAFDIHRRVLTLAAMWTAFDPFGAVVYHLHDLLESAWALREDVQNSKEYWDYTKEPYHPLRKIKEGNDNYETFGNHIKGIWGAVRRLERNKWFANSLPSNETLAKDFAEFKSVLSWIKGEL